MLHDASIVEQKVENYLNKVAINHIKTSMDISMGKYYVFTMVALKRQKGDDVHVVKEYTERLIKALGTEIAGFSLQSTLSTPAYKNLNPIGSQLMRGGNTPYIKALQSILQPRRTVSWDGWLLSSLDDWLAQEPLRSM